MAKAGHPTDYRPNFHPKEIIRLMKEEGKTAVQVARDWGIRTRTINNWSKKHKEFFRAYMRAQEYRKAWWLDKGQQGLIMPDGVRFDSRLFALMMKYDGTNLDERTIKLPALAGCKTFKEMGVVIICALACGKITVKEAQGYVETLSGIATLDEKTELRDKVEAIEIQLGKK